MFDHKKERESIAKLLFEIWWQTNHNDDLCEKIETKISDMGFKLEVTRLLDIQDNNHDVHKQPLKD